MLVRCFTYFLHRDWSQIDLHPRCSKFTINFYRSVELLPSGCNLGETFCQKTCNAIGRRYGICLDGYEVNISDGSNYV